MTLNCTRMDDRRDREPWVAAALSWLVPGMGQLYVRSWLPALVFLALAGALNVVLLAALTSPSLSLLWLAPFKVCGALLLPILAAFGAYRDAVRRNTPEFVRDRGLAKDPWLAVFLSLVLPGAGHAYIRKGGLALMAAVIFVTLYIAAGDHERLFVVKLIVYVVVCVHAYFACQVHRRTENRTMALMVVLVVLVQFSGNMALPRLYARFVFTMSPVLGPSMNPTLKEGDQVIVNNYAYYIRPPRTGDMVEFSVRDTAAGDFERVIKRVVAVGGETVQVIDGRILVDGKERDFKIPIPLNTAYPGTIPIEQFGEDKNPLLAFGVDRPLRVPEEHYFVLGDNLSYSMDSRCFGPVPRQNIVGRAVKIYWPPRRIKNLR